MKKNVLIMMMIFSIGVCIGAGPVNKVISATLKSDIIFRLDGKKVMNGQAAIMYNGTTYVPLKAVANTLGLGVEYTNGILDLFSTRNTGRIYTKEENRILQDLAEEQAITHFITLTPDTKIIVEPDPEEMSFEEQMKAIEKRLEEEAQK